MNSKLTLVAFAVSSLLFVSCQKEYSLRDEDTGNGPAPVDFKGTWNILQMASQGNNSSTTNLSGETFKSRLEYVYYTKNTVGRMLVDDQTFVAQDLGYTIDTTMTTKLYSNGSLITSIDVPFFLEMPPTSTTMTYRKIGADSIVLKGQIASIPSGGISVPAQAEEMGFRLMMSGDTLVMRGSSHFTLSQTVNGVPANYDVNLINLIKLKRP